jgi:serine/threonine protein kinase
MRRRRFGAVRGRPRSLLEGSPGTTGTAATRGLSARWPGWMFPGRIATVALTPRTRLGSYEILGPLGAGGMGEVYRAHDTRLGRDVAIKILSPRLSTLPEAHARLEREARIVSKLIDPHIHEDPAQGWKIVRDAPIMRRCGGCSRSRTDPPSAGSIGRPRR